MDRNDPLDSSLSKRTGFEATRREPFAQECKMPAGDQDGD